MKFVYLLFLTTVCFAETGLKEVSDGFAAGTTFQISSISPSEAQALMKAFKAESKIPFDYGIDGCEQRATAMAQIAHEQGVELGKVFVRGNLYADNSGSKLKPKFKEDVYGWTNHVAPMVYVKNGDRTEMMILDPSISESPMTLEKFKEAVTNKGKATWADGKKKAEPKIEKMYFGSRFQARSYEDYPAKMPAREMASENEKAYERLANIDYMSTPGSSWLNISEEEYCEKYGSYCNDKAKGERIRKLRQEAKAKQIASKPFQSCDSAEIKNIDAKQVGIPDGFQNSGYLNVTILSEEQANELMDFFKSNKKIPFKDSDNCHLRAHYMLQLAREKGIFLAKIFFEGNLNSKKPDSKGDSPLDYNSWVMHVAPIAVVRGKDGILRKKILDPSLFAEPKELAEFKEKLLVPKSYGQPPSINKIYCADQYQLEAKKDYDVKMPPHDMTQITKEILAKFEEIQSKFSGDVDNLILKEKVAQ
jgi:hypothetical protein